VETALGGLDVRGWETGFADARGREIEEALLQQADH